MSNLIERDMSELFYYGLSLQAWLLLGIVTYVFMILFLIYVKYCVSQRVFCPCFDCHLHYPHLELDVCTHVCSKCGGDICRSLFCCTKTHNITVGPEVKCRCFVPSCSYVHCFCCEVSVQNKIEQADVV